MKRQIQIMLTRINIILHHLGKRVLIASYRNPKTTDYDPMVEEVSFSCHLELHFTIVTYNR
ncbi:hypothetical protein HanHA300_Chr03g0103071 [Helianthus annuus]|nr:hypothetical protein HanHA300_Chr03g0103071 [Helianthus annuus]KAJ0608966.1 hypothetical protein HanHA89_Chr03g0114751 [Helianthus annuus]